MEKEKLETVDIKGKKYVTVNARIKYFNEAYPKGMISTEIITNERPVILMKAIVYPDSSDKERFFTGYAYEKEGDGFINKTSYIENCETSAIGRALGIMGIGVDTSIASAEEVANAVKNQEKPSKPQIAKPESISKPESKPQPTQIQEKEPQTTKDTPSDPQPPIKGYTERFIEAKKKLGEEDYYHILKKAGYESATQIKSKDKVEEILKIMASITNFSGAMEDAGL